MKNNILKINEIFHSIVDGSKNVRRDLTHPKYQGKDEWNIAGTSKEERMIASEAVFHYFQKK